MWIYLMILKSRNKIQDVNFSKQKCSIVLLFIIIVNVVVGMLVLLLGLLC